MEWITKSINYLTVAKGVALFQVFCLIAIAIYVGIVIPDLEEPVRYSKMCLSTSDGSSKCDRTEIILNSYVREVLENRYEDIVTKEKQIRDKYFKTQLETARPSANTGGKVHMKPMAKLVGKRQSKSTDSTRMTPVDTWHIEMELERGFVRNGARPYNGRLVVPVNGSYFVYSFVEFYEPCLYQSGFPNVEDKTSPIKHALYRYSVSDNNNIEVVSSAQPHRIVKGNTENVYNSHISTVLELYAGDELSVQVSNITLLEYTKDNYFGLRLI